MSDGSDVSYSSKNETRSNTRSAKVTTSRNLRRVVGTSTLAQVGASGSWYDVPGVRNALIFINTRVDRRKRERDR